MKKIIYLLVATFSFVLSKAQRSMTEGTITYNLSVVTDNKDPGMGDVFDGATLNVYLKGNMALSELKSMLLNQTIIYDDSKASATILKVAGEQKFIINLTAENWLQYNKKFEGITYTFEEETKTIAGYPCKKAIGKLTNGDTFTVFYATTLSPAIKGYDYQFKGLPGLALEYEVQSGKNKVRYSASKVVFSPVPSFKFDVPKTGYRVLEYKSNP